jgi:hypothetical protein
VGYGVILGIALLGSVFLALTATGRHAHLAIPTAKRVFANPWFAASLGVLLTFATSPLVWSHYYVLALVPIAWLVGRDGRWGVATWGAAICYLALAHVTINAFLSAGLSALLSSLTMICWIALVPGLLAYVREQRLAIEKAA